MPSRQRCWWVQAEAGASCRLLQVAVTGRVGIRYQAVDIIDTLKRLLGKFPAPTRIYVDNEPEFIAFVLQEWCVGSGTSTEYILPKSS